MVFLPGLDSKSYESTLGGGEVPVRICPDARCGGAVLRGHGWYLRYLDGQLQRFRRLRCPCCGVTHGVLPEDVCAYRDTPLSAVEAGLDAASPNAGAQASGQPGDAGVRRVRRWRARDEEAWAAQLRSLLPAVEGTWWQRAQKVFGPAPGWLLRLRHWLWQTYDLLFSGLSGLWRGGRPRRRPPAASTDFGNCPPAAADGKMSPTRFETTLERQTETSHHARGPTTADRTVSLRGHQ